MSSLQRVVGKSFKMVIRQSPDKAAENRRRLEALQAVDRPIILASRYNFSPALTFSLHQKHDPILQAAYPTLHNFSYSTFAGCMNPLEIEPLFSDDAVFLHQAMFYGSAASAMYAIGRYGMIAKVRLFINASDGQVFVQDQEKHIDLEEWLKTLPPPVGSVKGARGYECLQGWWKVKGQMFRLMELPPELWTSIFELAFGFDVYPGSYDSLGNGSSDKVYTRNKKCAPAPTKAVLFLDKKIHAAILPFVLKNTCKAFDVLHNFKRHLDDRIIGPGQFDRLKVLELDLSNTEYFQFFKVQVVPFIPHPLTVHSSFAIDASILAKLPALNHLYLRFTAPINGMQDPWYNTGQHNGHAINPPSDFRGHTRRLDIGCQKVVVDWILVFAKEYLEKIPLVTLYGCIKHSTKAKWDKILKDERASKHGEVHAMTDEKQMIKHWDLDDL